MKTTSKDQYAEALAATTKLFGNSTPEQQAKSEAYARYYCDEIDQIRRDYARGRGFLVFVLVFILFLIVISFLSIP